MRDARQNTHREKEREREAQRMSIFMKVGNSYKWQPTFTKGYKVTLYSDSLRATALYAIDINSLSFDCPKGQCEYGHYTLVFDKELCDSLSSISANVVDDEMVQICLGGLAPRFSAMWTVILAREKYPSFFDLQSMLLVKEKHVRTRRNTSEAHMLYTHSNGGRGRGWAKHKADEVRPTKTTPNFSRKMEAIEEPS